MVKHDIQGRSIAKFYVAIPREYCRCHYCRHADTQADPHGGLFVMAPDRGDRGTPVTRQESRTSHKRTVSVSASIPDRIEVGFGCNGDERENVNCQPSR